MTDLEKLYPCCEQFLRIITPLDPEATQEWRTCICGMRMEVRYLKPDENASEGDAEIRERGAKQGSLWVVH